MSTTTTGMKKISADDPMTRSADLVAENLERLRELFPAAFAEDGIDFEVLKQLLGGEVNEREEKYGLNWHGKRQARQIALTPSTGTLRPAPEESVDWDTTQNLMIEGDNLEVLKLLQKSYAGRVKMIYIDPPYNTGKDFVYPDDFRDNIRNYQEITGQVDGEGKRLSSNTEASGRFHTDWLNMMYPRLRLARSLLRDDGVLFVSIDDNEVAHLRTVIDDVFGADNFLASLIWKSGGTAAAHFTTQHEYVLSYAKDKEQLPLFRFSGDSLVSDRAIKKPSAKNPTSIIKFKAGLDFESEDKVFPSVIGSAEPVKVISGIFEAKHGKLAHDVSLEAAWSMADMINAWLDGQEVLDQKGQRITRFFFKSNGVLQYEKERATTHPNTVIEFVSTRNGSNELRSLMGAAVFDFPKPTQLIKHFIATATDKDSIVIDFFAGSGTTGHAVVEQNAEDSGNRRFILVQLPEPISADGRDLEAIADYCDKIGRPRNLAELTKERLRRASTKIRTEHPDYTGDLGFRVFKLDSSNIRAWHPDRGDLEGTLLEHTEHLVPGRTEQDILYEVLLKLGLDLCVPIEERRIADKTVHSIGGGVLLACLAEEITRAEAEPLAEGIAAWHAELRTVGDVTCIFRDSAFEDDVAKTNLAAILQQHGIKEVRSL